MSASVSPAARNRHNRILACVLCQHRKIKCDRNAPCSNCIKANVTCVPSTPAPARKRRRPNQDLQERLARCEELLKQYADGPTPGQTPAQETVTPTVSKAVKSETSELELPLSKKSSKFEPACRMVNDDGSVRYMDSHIWATVYEELQAMRDIVEAEDPEDSSILGSEELTPENNADLFFAGDLTSSSVDDFTPDPIHAFKLWQFFLDRVNPLFKVVHVPAVQPMIMDGATNLRGLPHHQQALIFSIYTTAALSLSEVESVQLLGMSRESAIQKFLAGTKVALVRFNFLKNYNMTALQALVHFVHSLQGRYDRHAAWVLTGTIVRIAQKMGYHRDGEVLGLDAYETEMRRRLWWQIIIQDSKYAMLSGLNQSVQPLHWDTKPPSNINDADIFPGAAEKVQSREGPTEMAFVLILNQIYKFKMDADMQNNGAAFEAAILGEDINGNNKGASQDPQEDVYNKFRRHFEQMVVNLQALEQTYIDVNAGNVHKAAKSIRHIFMGKIGDMMRPLKEQPEYGTEIFGPKDSLFKIFVIGTEQRLDQYDTMRECGFLWFVKSYFQMDIFAVMTGQLCERPTGSLADRAWKTIERSYGYHAELFDMTQKQYSIQAHITLRAWRAREHAFAQARQHLETPRYIQRLRELLPSYESKSSTQSIGATPPFFGSKEGQLPAVQATPFPGLPSVPDSSPQQAPSQQFQQLQLHQQHQAQQQQQQQQQQQHPQQSQQQQQSPGVVDPFLGGLLDMSGMDWDMFGDALNPQDQLSVGMFGYGGFPAPTNGAAMPNHFNARRFN